MLATTVYVYWVDDWRPVIVIGEEEAVPVNPPGDDVAVYVLPRIVPGVNAIEYYLTNNYLEFLPDGTIQGQSDLKEFASDNDDKSSTPQFLGFKLNSFNLFTTELYKLGFGLVILLVLGIKLFFILPCFSSIHSKSFWPTIITF